MGSSMIDIHCHILPGIDDGARDVATGLQLLRMEKETGVDRLFFTPHFSSDKISVDEFVKRRADALDRLCSAAGYDTIGVEHKLGAEIYYTVALSELDLDKLCFEGTDYVLVELPTQARPHGMKRTFGNIINNGYRPIIAHVERYSYMLKDPKMLYELIDMGCLAQINSEALLEKNKLTSMVLYFVRHGLVHFICSDCHSAHRRPPDLDKGFEAVEKQLGEKYAERFLENAEALFNGRVIDPDYIKKPVNVMGMWL